jgi:hypothetical protein
MRKFALQKVYSRGGGSSVKARKSQERRDGMRKLEREKKDSEKEAKGIAKVDIA